MVRLPAQQHVEDDGFDLRAVAAPAGQNSPARAIVRHLRESSSRGRLQTKRLARFKQGEQTFTHLAVAP